MGLVLAGGAARGAYEVGVVAHILEEVSRDLGREVPLDVMCGTSVGAINVCALAAWADEPGKARAARLVRHWSELRIDQIVKPDGREVLALLGTLVGRSLKPWRRGGVLDPAGLMRLLHAAVPFSRIGQHLQAGRLHAISVSTTHVATGKTVVFVQRAAPGLPPWSRDPTVVPRAAALGMSHALASAAIPLLFPPVRIEGDYHCDGGLRQNVPFSPARRLGADRLIVVSPRTIGPPRRGVDALAGGTAANAPPTPLFLLGKALNALLLDRLDGDLDRLERINEILDAGTRLYGPNFVRDLNRELGREPGREVRPLELQVIRASQDIGAIAADLARNGELACRAQGVVGRLLRKLSEGERESDLLSYLMFDGEFARVLIELGRADARARHQALCKFFSDAMDPAAAVA